MTMDVTGISPQLRPAVLSLAEQMRADGIQRSDPVREIPALLGDRWTSLILLVLDMGRWRHADLRRVLGRLAAEGRISQRVMTEKLRTLERNGLVRREATADVPPKVSYELTPVGRSLTGEARRLIAWVHAHRAEIDAARSAFGERALDPQPR
jgi:DNA-binding HxlR family transcriptional regulator